MPSILVALALTSGIAESADKWIGPRQSRLEWLVAATFVDHDSVLVESPIGHSFRIDKYSSQVVLSSERQ
jgi:hypothetical protein